MSTPNFEDAPPPSDCVTAYDERQFVTYLRLLEAAKEDADWREVAAIIFGIATADEPERAWSVYQTHLARAQWMCRCGYLHLRGSD